MNRVKGENRGGPEDVFRIHLQQVAQFMGHRLKHIPDHVINKGNKHEDRRKFRRKPCDAILSISGSPGFNYFIELKAGKNKLTPHEKIVMQDMETVNKSYFVVRKNERYLKRQNKICTDYTIEKPGIWEKPIEVDSIDRIIRWFEVHSDTAWMVFCKRKGLTTL